jgi:hypothetical protein
MRTLSICLLLLLGAWGVASKTPEYKPRETRIAVVPLINATELKWEDLKQRQVDRGNEFLREEFAKRGFELVDQKKVNEALEKLEIDMSDEEQQKRDTLYTLGREVEADLVVFALIFETDQKLHKILDIGSPVACVEPYGDILPTIGDIGQKIIDPVMPAQREGKAKLKLWLLDVKKEKPILSAKKAEGKSKGGYFAFFDKGSKRQVAAVANALETLLKDFFKPYPVQKKKK